MPGKDIGVYISVFNGSELGTIGAEGVGLHGFGAEDAGEGPPVIQGAQDFIDSIAAKHTFRVVGLLKFSG